MDTRPHNLASSVYAMAKAQPDALAFAFPSKPWFRPSGRSTPYRRVTYGELALATDRVAKALKRWDFRPGDRVVLMVPPSLAFFTLVYASLQCGIIPVLIDPGIGLNNLKTCIREARPVGFIGITKAHLARVLLGWGRASITKRVTIGPKLFWGGQRLGQLGASHYSDRPAPCLEVKPDDLASIGFTTGSTGVPKGVMNTHGNLRQQVNVIRDNFKLKPGEIDLPTFAPFALLNPVVGMTTIMPPMDTTRPARVDPRGLIRTVRRFGVQSLFASPVLLERVGRYGATRGIELPSLRRVFSAGAPVSAGALRAFSQMLHPSARIYTPYGATEAMPVSWADHRQLLQEDVLARTASGAGICIGQTAAGLSTEIIEVTDDAISAWSDARKLSDGQIGEIAVRGGNVSHAYFNRQASTQRAKIPDGQAFWHRMGDLGYKDERGNIWFCGRKAHRVRLPGGTLYSVPCECIFNRHPWVRRTALVGVGSRAVLCVEPESGLNRPKRRELRRELLEWASEREMTRPIQTILFHRAFPVDIRHNAKINRQRLAHWAAARLGLPAHNPTIANRHRPCP